MAAGYECIMHMHAIAEQVEISEVTGKEDPVSKKMVKSTFLKSDERGRAVIKVKNLIFRLPIRFACKNTSLCLVWEDSPSEIKESTFNLTQDNRLRIGDRNQALEGSDGLTEVAAKKPSRKGRSLLKAPKQRAMNFV